MIPTDALEVLNQLNNSGFEAYFVGGCVRDLILEREPKDWDITTNARPDQVKSLFKKTVDTGIKHGTVSVIIRRTAFEVTTYRIDGDYEDYRRPSNVFFTDSLKEDLSRRDFTMNAIAYDPFNGFFDPFDGKKDIENKIVRTVGDPNQRFMEDALRMLRAYRFCSELSFTIFEDTKSAIQKNSALVSHVSKERIRDELRKILISDNPNIILNLGDSGLLTYILPEFLPLLQTEQNNPYHVYNAAEHTLIAVQRIEPTFILRLSMFLHDIGKPCTKTTDKNGIDHFYGHVEKSIEIATPILMRLKLDNHAIEIILQLIKYHDYPLLPNRKSVKKMLNLIGVEQLQLLLKVKEADSFAQNPLYFEASISDLRAVQKMIQEILLEKECFALKDLSLNGNDLVAIGYVGKQIGNTLDMLLMAVIENPDLNQKDKLLQYLFEKDTIT